MSERKGRITIRFHDHSSRRLRCTLVGEHLAVHEQINRYGDRGPRWTVTHLPSARLIAQCDTADLAMGCAREFDRWCRPMLENCALYREIREKWEAK